jgi:hypothetical protein
MLFRHLTDNRRSRAAALVATFAVMLDLSALAQIKASKADAAAMKKKVAAISELAQHPTPQGQRTTLTENEVNSYLLLEVSGDLPPGVVEPTVSALGEGRLSGRAVVDLDAVRKANSSASLFDIRSYLTGQLPVTAVGLLHTNNGMARFELQSATVGAVPVPKVILQEIVAFYSKTPSNPAGISLDEQFALPARIREIQVERGQAIIVQ